MLFEEFNMPWANASSIITIAAADVARMRSSRIADTLFRPSWFISSFLMIIAGRRLARHRLKGADRRRRPPRHDPRHRPPRLGWLHRERWNSALPPRDHQHLEMRLHRDCQTAISRHHQTTIYHHPD